MASLRLIQLPLFLTALMLITLAPPLTAPLCPPAAWANQRRDFGRIGRSGVDGQPGREGRSGQTQTVFATGASVNLDLVGQPGSDGADGSDGENAYCDRQPRNVDHDLKAADGGRGGNGGYGGNGGNGGSVTVYYKNLNDLKKILVRSIPGEGGRGGRGGRGGYGCRCSQRSWEIKTCTGTPGSSDYRCTTKRYACTDGIDGGQGSDGGNGRSGQIGQLSLVQRQQALPEEMPTKTIPLSTISGQPFTLSKNKWLIKPGATSLLASGSLIADSYREFVERLEGSFQLVWQEPNPASSFAGAMTVALKDDRTISTSFPEDLWVQSYVSQKANLTQLAVVNVIRRTEVTRLAVSDFAKSGSDLQFSIVDLARKSGVISTQFRIKYRTSESGRFGDAFADYQTRYEGTIPDQFVTRDFNRFVLNLGKLPIDGKYLAPNTPVEIELVAVRSLGDRSAEQSITWKGRVRG
jgi:hypothetical protein